MGIIKIDGDTIKAGANTGGAAGGALIGAALGAPATPIGAAAGAVIGSVVGLIVSFGIDIIVRKAGSQAFNRGVQFKVNLLESASRAAMGPFGGIFRGIRGAVTGRDFEPVWDIRYQ